MPVTTLQVRPLTGALGAEIEGVDLSRPLAKEQSEDIHQAFLKHQVLVFRGQTLTPQQQVGVAKLFGKPAIYPFLRGLDEAPEVSVLAKAPEDKVIFGDQTTLDERINNFRNFSFIFDTVVYFV